MGRAVNLKVAKQQYLISFQCVQHSLVICRLMYLKISSSFGRNIQIQVLLSSNPIFLVSAGRSLVEGLVGWNGLSLSVSPSLPFVEDSWDLQLRSTCYRGRTQEWVIPFL